MIFILHNQIRKYPSYFKTWAHIFFNCNTSPLPPYGIFFHFFLRLFLFFWEKEKEKRKELWAVNPEKRLIENENLLLSSHIYEGLLRERKL